MSWPANRKAFRLANRMLLNFVSVLSGLGSRFPLVAWWMAKSTRSVCRVPISFTPECDLGSTTAWKNVSNVLLFLAMVNQVHGIHLVIWPRRGWANKPISSIWFRRADFTEPPSDDDCCAPNRVLLCWPRFDQRSVSFSNDQEDSHRAATYQIQCQVRRLLFQREHGTPSPPASRQ